MKFNIVFVLIVLKNVCFCARILVIFSAPIPSHQLFIRPIIHQLLNHDHEVVLVTSDPEHVYHENLTEIDLHNQSYNIMRRERKRFENVGNPIKIVETISIVLNMVFQKQLDKELLEKLNAFDNYDVLIVDACARTFLALSETFKVPVILINSFSAQVSFFEETGAPVHPLLNPLPYQKRLYNLTLWESIMSVHIDNAVRHQVDKLERKININLKNFFGYATPLITNLRENIAVSFLNTHPIWEDNRALPKSVVNIGGSQSYETKELPQDIKSFLDDATSGAIYVSFGTNVASSLISSEQSKIFKNVFNKLPYKVLWKTDYNIIGSSNNIMTSKWFPQKDILGHPNLKLFITQGGQHSIDESINAGVPLIALPMYLDQWYNAEKIAKHKMGIKLDMHALDENILKRAIHNVVEDSRYKENILKLRALMQDQQHSPLSRAVWWIEYVVRHRGARHLRSPAANMPWTEYYAIDVFALFIFMILSVSLSCFAVICLVVRWFRRLMRSS